MICSKKILDSKVIKELKKLVGNNDSLLTEMVLTSFDDEQLDSNFVEWYNNKHPKSKEISIDSNTTQAKTIAKEILNYYYAKHPNVDSTARVSATDDHVIYFGYDSIFEREEGLQHTSTFILDHFREVQKNNIILPENKYKYYLRQVKKQWLNLLLNSVANKTNKDITVVRQEYIEAIDKCNYLETQLEKDGISISDKNKLAVYRELFSDDVTALNYIKNVFADPKLIDINSEIKDDIEAESVKLAQDASQDMTGDDTSTTLQDDLAFDTTITQLSNHIGQYTSFMTHVGSRIRNYFNTLRVLASPTLGDVDTNNTYGIAKTMDANACASILYNNNIDFHNIATMIDSIQKIGERIKGFEAFVTFANDLRNDLDFAHEVWSVFAKIKMTKIQTLTENGIAVVKVTNTRADAKSAFTFDLMNDIKTTALDNDSSVMSSVYSDLKKELKHIQFDKISDETSLKKELETVKNKLIKLYKTYFPSIQENAIESYIQLNNADLKNAGNLSTQIQNITNLLDNIHDIINKSDTTKRNYNKMMIAAAEIAEHNNKLDEKRKNKEWVDLNDYKSTKLVYSDDYIQNQIASINVIVDFLLPYSIIDTSLNSRNIYGNNTSDVINTSLITQLTKMLKNNHIETVTNEKGITYNRIRNKALEQWGLRKLRSKQYKYSNVLLEQTDENGKILNKGLFKYIDGQLCITPYAHELLDYVNFIGSSNSDNGSNVGYARMVGGNDYTVTSFIQFFKTKNESTELKDINFAYYFLRTPSDAPQTFALKAPRYNTSDLFILKDENAFNEQVDRLVDEAIPYISINDFKNKYKNPKSDKASMSISDDKILQYLIPKKRLIITNFDAINELNDNKAYVTIRTESNFLFILEGDLVQVGKGKALDNASLVGVVGGNAETGQLYTSVPEYIMSIARSYYSEELKLHDITINDNVYKQAEYITNKNSVVYKMFKNQYKQELLNAAVALNHYFELVKTKDGNYVVKFENGKPKLKAGISNTEGCVFYHLDKEGKVLNTKNHEYVLNGNVFHSNKFKLTVYNEDHKLINKNYLDKIITTNSLNDKNNNINLLYGEGFKIIATENEDGTLDVQDVKLGEEQENNVDNHLDEFLKDYVNQSYEKIQQVSSLIENASEDVKINRNNIIEYAINQQLMHYSYDEILDGDSKFYKDAQTGFKRAKQGQGSGVPYGISDYSADFTPNLDETKNSFINEGFIEEPVYEEYINEKGKTVRRKKVNDNGEVETVKRFIAKDIFDNHPLLKGVRQRNGFRAVTVKNTQMTNVTALEELTKQLQAIYIRDLGLDKKAAEDKARSLLYGPVTDEKKKGGNYIKNFDGSETYRKGGFTDTKVNDAQSYITIQEFARRVAARGQLVRYLPLFEKLKDPNAILTAKDLNEFIQVQKNFYYDMYYDEKYGIERPRQIKNAEFVLVPQLIRGTQLEKVYNMMQEGNIDQLNTVETSKASNSVVLTLWDNNGDISQERLDNFAKEADANAEIYSYNNLYTQQETPQHMNSMNKAGSQITKKIIDNIPDDDSELGKLKRDYLDTYSENIKQSNIDLLTDFEVPLDENGNILFEEDDTIQDINKKVFYDRLKEELIRIGADNNSFDYVDIKPDASTPEMPVYRNNMINKFESIVQSMFNNAITRQKLPGFHAAQVTNVGWRPLSDKVENVSYDKDLRYHPDGEAYIEVLLPYSFVGIDKNSEHYKNMSDDEILKELQNKGLDKVIGYRIPTESKASSCVMKIAGFVSDGYGSTIVVPNDWVSQTGSDFDIDSVYGIQFETIKTADGEIKKIKYKEQLTKQDWFAYIRRNTNKSLNINAKENHKQALQKVKTEIDKTIKALQTYETKYWNAFSENEQLSLKKRQAIITKKINELDLTGKDAYLFRLNEFIEYLNKVISRTKDEAFINKCKKLIEVDKQIYNFLNDEESYFAEKYDEEIAKLTELDIEKVNDLAKEAGLLTYKEFIDPTKTLQNNTQRARNSRICDIMLKILSHPASLEENLSRSNFDKLVAARNEYMAEDVATERDNRDFYNVFDQIAFQSDAMSGRQLKAISVMYDTFCSICNTVKPTFTEPVYVVYDATSYESVETLKKRFGNVKYDDKTKTIRIKHDKYGHTSDNRNMEGDLLTAYSSETTALSFDAIKEGNIPNVNEYSFITFKNLVNLGLDYRTAVAFIMQPGISRIIQHYNLNNSIYSFGKNNPIHEAIRDIANELNITNDNNTPIVSVLAAINKKYNKEFNTIFKQTGDEDIKISLNNEDTQSLPIITTKLIDRLKNKGKFTSKSPIKDKLLFDLGVILMFNKLYYASNQINDIVQCCNPDRFGAKQSVYATRRIFDDIDRAIFDREKVVSYDFDEEREIIKINKKRRNPILTVNGKHILASIYPGVDNETYSVNDVIKAVATNDNLNDSSYKFLYAFLKYASATSVIIAKNLFETQNDTFVKLVTNLASTFSGYDNILSDEQYNDFQKYMISSLDKECPSIKYPVQVRKIDDEIKLIIKTPNYDENNVENTESELFIAKNETSRIYGYEHHGTIERVVKETTITNDGKEKHVTSYKPVVIADLNNPTDEEMQEFEELSPAQKVKYIQTNFSNPGVFGMFNVSLFNAKARGRFAGMQTIEYIEQNINPNVVYGEFRKAFFNKNPLIVSAAIDLVKYSTQVEGMRMSARAINKVVDNDCLINSFGPDGLGLIDFVRDEMNNISTSKGRWSTTTAVKQLYENYLRSHTGISQIRTLYLNKKNEYKYDLHKLPYGMYFLRKEDNNDAEKAQKKFNERLNKMGIKYYLPISDVYGTNKYIQIKQKNVTRLYKINDFGNYVILYPLSNLELNENSEWSAREDNNQGIISKSAYEAICVDYAKRQKELEFNSDYIRNKVKELNQEKEIEDVFYNKRKDYNKKLQAEPFNLQQMANDNPGGGMYNVLQSILTHFKTGFEKELFIRSNALQDYIFNKGSQYGHTEIITFGKNDKRRILIEKPNNISKIVKYYITDDNSTEAIVWPSLKRIIDDVKESKINSRLDNVFAVSILPDTEAYASSYEEGSYDDSLEDVNSAAIEYMKSIRDSKDFEPAIDSIEKLRVNNITAQQESIRKNLGIATRECAKFATHTADFIKKNLFDQFIEDPENPGFYISITDPKIQKLIKDDKKLLNKYFEAINMADSFINVFSTYDGMEVTSEDTDIRSYLQDITESVKKIKALPVNYLRRKGMIVTVEKYSTNPTIKEQLISVFDGFWKAEGSMWKFHDIAENGTPILSVILKEVAGNIDAARVHQIAMNQEYWKKIRDIERRAKEAGKTINFDNVIDKDGRFIRDYTPLFADTLEELRQARDDAARKGLGSIEHLKAQVAYDEFKAKFTNQEVKPEYYLQRVALQKAMLYGEEPIEDDLPFDVSPSRAYPELYSAYMKLFYQQIELYKQISEKGLNDEDTKKLREIRREIIKLTDLSGYEKDGEWHEGRPHREENVTYTKEEEQELQMNSIEAVSALNHYIDAMQSLNASYFEDVDVHGFRQQLKINLNIKESFEDRDADGIPRKPQDWLDAQPEYREAVLWLENNASFKLKEVRGDGGKPLSVMAKVKDACKRLSLTSSNKNKEAVRIINAHDDGKGIKVDGIYDGTKLSDEERAEIKQAQRVGFSKRALKDGSMLAENTDRILISNAKPDNEVYNKTFYDKLATSQGKTQEYYNIVTEINKILEKYYTHSDGIIHIENIPDTEEGLEDIKTLGSLYQQLRALRATDITAGASPNAAFIKENVEFKANTDLFNAQIELCRNKSREFQQALNVILFERDIEGNYIQKENGDFEYNRFLYSYARPKEEVRNSWIDHQKNEDIKLLNHVYRTVPTKYYYKTKNEAIKYDMEHPGENYFKKWFIANHVYNPYTRQMEPLVCWTKTEIRYENFENNTFEGEWTPKLNQRERKPKSGKRKYYFEGETIELDDPGADMRNPNYKPDLGILANYVKGAQGGIYDSKVIQNDYEKEMSEYLQDVLMQTANIESARRYFKKGYAPRMRKSVKDDKGQILKEVGKFLGFGISTETGRKPWQTAIGYEHDFAPNMPMTELLKNKQSIADLEQKEKYKEELNKLDKEEFDTETEYEAKRAELEKLIKEKEDAIKQVNNDLLNRNWTEVIAKYLDQASRYNAIKENKEKLYFLLGVLRNFKMYNREFGISGNLKQNDRRTSKEQVVYDENVDTQLLEQYENFLRRLLFDQWKEPEDKRTLLGNSLQGFTSANYMMLNIRGGIGNVTLGLTGILAEAKAKEYIGVKDWNFGTNEWRKGIIGFARRGFYIMHGEDRCFNKQDAIVQYCNVLDYDEHDCVVRELSTEEYAEKLRNIMFSPQHMGEHFMQNSMLFAMLHSHKIVTMHNGTSTYMSKKDYIRYRSGDILNNILNPQQRAAFNKFKEDIKSDKNILKDYAWFRKDALTRFVYLHCSEKQINDFIKERKKYKKQFSEEFDEKINMYEQMELSTDGYLKFKDGSDLAKLHMELSQDGNGITKAEALMGRFNEKVRKVNNKIHGVYNKDGAAYIERKWYGSLIMQFHKHLPMGILKRYMARGRWNEFRDSIDKGMVQSFTDFLTLNMDKIKHDASLTDDELGALQGFWFLLTHLRDYFGQLTTTWKILPDYEKDNIARNIGDAVGVVGALAMTIALWYIARDDDEMQDSMLFNLALYEADRLCSEAFMYNPLGAISEGRKLMSQPVAVQSIIADTYKTINGIFDFMFNEDYDPYYKSGRFAKQSKIAVYIQRRIPGWYGIKSVLDTPKSNHYYKMGTNAIGFFNPKKMVIGE